MGYYLYALNEFKWTPDQWVKLNKREKSLVIACIDIIIEKQEEAQKEM